MTHWKSWAIGLQNDGDVSEAYIGSITNVDTPIETNFDFSETAGLVYSEHVTVGQQIPRVNTASFNIKQLLDSIGVLGSIFEEGSSSETGAAVYQARYNDLAIGTGSVHRRLRFRKAMATLGSLTCSHRGDASIDMMLHGLFDGTNNPIVPETAVALPTLPASGGRWTLADTTLTIGNSTFTVPVGCATELSLDFGIDVQSFGCDSEVYDSKLDIRSIRPSVRMTIFNLDLFQEASTSHIPLAGVDADHAQTTLRFRKRLNGQAGFVADGTAEHITMTLDGIFTIVNAHNATTNDVATMQIEGSLTWDGTNAPIIVDTAATLS